MPTPQKIQDAIGGVHDQKSFVQELLVDTLGWPIRGDVESLEDVSYPWTAAELRADSLERRIVDNKIWQIQPFSSNQPWGVFIIDFVNEDLFQTGRGMTGMLRRILSSLIPKKRRSPDQRSWKREHLLFVTTYQYRHFRFAYFKAPTDDMKSAPLAHFGWRENDTHVRTLCEHNLPALAFPDDDGADVNNWVTKWSSAFDVEQVTKRFFQDYRDVFENVESAVKGIKDDTNRRFYTQRLFNRLMFLYFIEKKGWLSFEGSKKYLRSLFNAAKKNDQDFLNDRLYPLFFAGLSNNYSELDESMRAKNEKIFGCVPYINGGLFCIADDYDVRDAVKIPNRAFAVILGLFERYNFTVSESTPLDIEVAVDPEMLGKVFEELVTARHKTGAYYTPRTVVSFMCRESLKGYLGGYEKLVDRGDDHGISHSEARRLLETLAKVKVCDPACGSGAYLVGMMHEIHNIIRILEIRIDKTTPEGDYKRKLQIIQNNLYGVDNDEFAINIARLRLWLSLAVEYEGSQPEPLPNLDFKIEIGDSLITKNPEKVDVELHGPVVRKLAKAKDQFMQEHDYEKKKALQAEIQELRQSLAAWVSSDNPDQFDWSVDFAEVFLEGGFDIAIANPPYGLKVSDDLRKTYFPNKKGEENQSKDSYGIFMARVLQLLRQGGYFTFIVSDTWRTIRTHRRLRKKLVDETTVCHMLDLPSWIFGATVNTCILSLRKGKAPEDHQLIAGDLRGIEKGNWKSLSDNLIAVSGHGPDIQTSTCARYTYPQLLIRTYSGLSFFVASSNLYKLMNNKVATRSEYNHELIHIDINNSVVNIKILGKISEIRKGIDTGENSHFLYQNPDAWGNYRDINHFRNFIIKQADLRFIYTHSSIRNKIIEKGFHKSKDKPHFDSDCWFEGRYIVPYDKGGESDSKAGWLPNYLVPTDYFIDWSQTSVRELKQRTLRESGNHKATIRNKDYWFRPGITFSLTGFYAPTLRYNSTGLFDNNGSCVFVQDDLIENVLGVLVSFTGKYIFKNFIDHTVHAHVDDFKNFIVLAENNERITKLVKTITQKQQENPRYLYYEHEQKEIDTLVYQLYGLNDEDIREIRLWYCRRYLKLAEAQGVLAEVKEKYADHLARCQRILEKPPSYWRSNPILELIAQGESHTLEFKETLEYDIRQNQQNRNLNKASLKTIAAFLNADGGTLLIGVSDSGEVKGIARDLQFVRGNNIDGFEQKLRSLVNDHFDPSPLGNVEITFEELHEGTVCQIRAEQSSKPIAFDNDFHIRDGNGTRKIEGRALTDWIQQRAN